MKWRKHYKLHGLFKDNKGTPGTYLHHEFNSKKKKGKKANSLKNTNYHNSPIMKNII